MSTYRVDEPALSMRSGGCQPDGMTSGASPQVGSDQEALEAAEEEEELYGTPIPTSFYETTYVGSDQKAQYDRSVEGLPWDCVDLEGGLSRSSIPGRPRRSLRRKATVPGTSTFANTTVRSPPHGTLRSAPTIQPSIPETKIAGGCPSDSARLVDIEGQTGAFGDSSPTQLTPWERWRKAMRSASVTASDLYTNGFRDTPQTRANDASLREPSFDTPEKMV